MDQQEEIASEADICAHLGAHDWLQSPGDAQVYDGDRALFPTDPVTWVQEIFGGP